MVLHVKIAPKKQNHGRSEASKRGVVFTTGQEFS